MNYKQSLKVDTQIFVVGPQIANPQILGLILQTQNHKFLRCASPQNRKSANLWKLLVGSRMQRSESNQLSRPRDIRRIFWGFCINRLGIGPLHYVSSRSDFGFEFLEIFLSQIRKCLCCPSPQIAIPQGKKQCF
jgi:hypothetical protein